MLNSKNPLIIKSYFLNGDHLENFKNCLREQEYKGTVVQEQEDVIEKEEVAESQYEKVEEVHELPLRKRIIKREHDEDEEINPHDIDFGK